MKNKNLQKNLKYFSLSIIIAFVLSFPTPSVFALPSTELTYHGKLTDLSDVPVTDGNYDLIFKIFDSSSGGTCLWVSRGTCGSPTTKSISVTKGIFYTILGESGDNALTLDFNSDYYLEIKVGTNSPMSPRRKITGNNFSINSGKLNGQLSSYFLDTSSTEQTKSGNLNLSSNLSLTGIFKDKDGDAGSSGQVLSSTGTATDWITNTSGASTYSTVNLDDSRKINSPTTVTTLDKAYDYIWSAGLFSGFELTDNGNGTVNIAGGEGVLRTSASPTAPLQLIKVTGVNNLALIDNSTNYLYVNYNAGSPTINTTSSLTDFNCLDKCILYRASRTGNSIRYINMMSNNVDANRSYRRKDFEMGQIDIGSGARVSEVGQRYLNITAGSFWVILSRLTSPAFNTSGADTFDVYYRNGSGGWTKTTGNTQINNTQYDNGTGTLATIANNKFGVRFVFMVVSEAGSRPVVLMGQDEHPTREDAENEPVPGDLPPEIDALGSILALTTIQKSATNLASILNATENTFSTALPTTHNNLAGLEGGTAGEYYHLTAAQSGQLPTSALTQGSVVFAGASGLLSQDNTNLFWDDTNNRLGIGTNTPSKQLQLTGNIEIPNTTFASQNGIIYKNGQTFIHNFNYGNNGSLNTDGQNIFIGYLAGNFTMGSTATLSNHSSYNIGVGFGSLYANTTGYNNIALGIQTLNANTTGYNNSTLGYYSLFGNTSGYENTAVGSNAGRYFTSGSNNQTSNTSTYLGAETRSNADGDVNETVIGYGAIGNGSNSVTLGNTSVTKTILHGNVGIGEPNPVYKFHLTHTPAEGTAVATFVNSLGGVTRNDGIYIYAGNDTGVSNSQFITFKRYDGTPIGAVIQNAATTVSYNTTSDIRVKENITPTSFGLADLLQINVADYNFISDSNKKKSTGFIAQDLYKIYPEAVTTNGDSGIDPLRPNASPWMVDYSKLTPLTVKAIQEQQKEIKELQKQNEKQDKEIEELKLMINTMLKK